jgi:hypothetical protein
MVPLHIKGRVGFIASGVQNFASLPLAEDEAEINAGRAFDLNVNAPRGRR